MGLFDKLFGRSKTLNSVPGALVFSQKGTGKVIYNQLTPHMGQFMGRCMGAIKKSGITAKGTGQFSILVGEKQTELHLSKFYQPRDDEHLIEVVVNEAKKLK